MLSSYISPLCGVCCLGFWFIWVFVVVTFVNFGRKGIECFSEQT